MKNKVTTKEEIIKRILEERERLASLGVVSIGLFGSFVRDEQTPMSDIDILVEFEPEKHTFDNFMEISFLLEDLLGRKVEVVTPEGLSPHIGPHILREVERVPVAA
jgi:predicted nucleotidyltransferase